MSRQPFFTEQAHVVVSTDGYFDVYPSPDRSPADKPVYRGRLSELGPGIQGGNERLAVRPGSRVLAEAVTAWAVANGAKALSGGMGGGRDGNEPELTT